MAWGDMRAGAVGWATLGLTCPATGGLAIPMKGGRRRPGPAAAPAGLGAVAGDALLDLSLSSSDFFLVGGSSLRVAGLYSAVRSTLTLLDMLTGSRGWPGPPAFSMLSPVMAGRRKWRECSRF